MTDANNYVSRASAFWGILPIVLNSMTLPSGKLLGAPRSWNFVLRCSPVICGLGAIDNVVRLIHYSWRSKSMSGGLEWWVADRLADTEKLGLDILPASSNPSQASLVEPEFQTTFEKLRHNEIFLWLLFMVGALPQAIKIFAATGIPIIQWICAAYLASFMVDKLFVLAAAKRRNALAPALPSDISPVVMITHLALMYGGLLGTLLMQWGIPIVVVSDWGKTYGYAWAQYFAFLHIPASIGLVWLGKGKESENLVLGAWFLLNCLYVALIYFALSYDPSITFKPAWTNYLG